MAWPALAAPKSSNCRALCLPASWCHTYSWTWGAPAGNCKPPVHHHATPIPLAFFPLIQRRVLPTKWTNFTPSYNLPLNQERYYKTPFLSHSSSIINSFLPRLVYYYSIILRIPIQPSSYPNMAILYFLPILLLLSPSLTGARQLADSTPSPMLFQYHKGPLLTGKLSVNLVWYDNIKPAQRAILSDFVASLSSTSPKSPQPSVATWWWSTHKLYSSLAASKSAAAFSVGKQIMDPRYSLGKSLTSQHIRRLARRAGDTPNSVNVVFTADDVAVEGFCRSSCGTHGVLQKRVPYIWVGNSETQCPGQCAWPFHKPIYGPQGPALVAPNNDVGVDGMVINLATLLAGTVTNPFGNGYYQGPKEAPLEAASACPGVYGKGAYPGYPGNLLVDPTTGASYNANGVNGRKYLLPALYDPATSSCSTLL